MHDLPLMEVILRLILALGPAAIIGLERELSGHLAGLRTHLLVSLGACIFTLSGSLFVDGTQDPTRIAAQVASGIGFLGAGAILRDGFRVSGLTTAASMWGTAAVGVAAGLGATRVALVGGVAALIVLAGLRWVAKLLPKGSRQRVVITFDATADLHASLSATQEVLTDFTVLSLHSTSDGRHKLTGRASTKDEPMITIAALTGLPGVSGVEFHT